MMKYDWTTNYHQFDGRNRKPRRFCVSLLSQSEIEGGKTEESAQMFDIISGNGTEAQNNVVCANAGMAIAVTKCTPLEGFQIAKESLLSGKG
jgi:anthranilate phosphoribosyltransferase